NDARHHDGTNHANTHPAQVHGVPAPAKTRALTRTGSRSGFVKCIVCVTEAPGASDVPTGRMKYGLGGKIRQVNPAGSIGLTFALSLLRTSNIGETRAVDPVFFTVIDPTACPVVRS